MKVPQQVIELPAARRVAAIAFAVVAVGFVAFGIFDPLEGGMALLMGIIPLAAARVLSQVPFPNLLRYPFAVAIVSGVIAIVLAINTGDGTPPAVWALVAVYEVSVAISIIGSVANVVAIVRGTRAAA